MPAAGWLHPEGGRGVMTGLSCVSSGVVEPVGRQDVSTES